MTLDLTKPLRHKASKVHYKFLHKLMGSADNNIVVICTSPTGIEQVFIHSERNLENIPESRWLNVYAGVMVRVDWHSSRQAADKLGRGWTDRIAILEDKQDGSPWILHQL